MTYTSTPPTVPGWYWCKWNGSQDPAYLDGTGVWRDSTLDADTQVKGLIPPERFGPRIPSPEEIEAMEECVGYLRISYGDTHAGWDKATQALARLDAIQGEAK